MSAACSRRGRSGAEGLSDTSRLARIVRQALGGGAQIQPVNHMRAFQAEYGMVSPV